jgi:hypothetical protein
MKDWGMKDWIMELCPEIADWQAEMIAEAAHNQVLDEREACAKVCDAYDVAEDVNSSDTAEGIAIAIRARGQG